MKAVATLSALLATASATKVSYDGYKVFRVPVTDNLDQVKSAISDLGLETWKSVNKPGAYADIVVPPAKLKDFTAKAASWDAEVMHDNLGESVSNESTFKAYRAGRAPDATWFDSYHSYADHQSFLTDLQAAHSGNSAIVSSGESLEGNSINGIHMYGSGGPGTKPGIVLHAAVHAREWITSMTVEYFAFTILGNYGTDEEITGFLDAYDIYIFPFVNPDGFIYSQESDRMWRKNRQGSGSCLGHDINRNWPYQWDVSGGASDDPCAQDFRGDEAGDAPETQALSAFLQGIKDNQGLKLYIDYHSYSQLFMTPYGYDCNALPDNNDELQTLARGASDAIEAVHGTEFVSGPICSTIYKATGSSVDYAADVTGSEYTFTLELRDTGRYGFVLPPEQIVPAAEETWAGLAHLLANMN